MSVLIVFNSFFYLGCIRAHEKKFLEQFTANTESLLSFSQMQPFCLLQSFATAFQNATTDSFWPFYFKQTYDSPSMFICAFTSLKLEHVCLWRPAE